MDKSRGAGIVLAASSMLAGCGLTVIGTYDGTEREVVEVGPAPKAVAPPPTPPPAETKTSARSAPRDGSATAPFCDRADPELIACFEFEDDLADGSSHAQVVEVSGPTAFVAGLHGRAVDLTEATRLHVPSGPAWTYGPLTIELRFRAASLPADGARAGLLDKEGAFGVFLHSDGTVSCTMGAVVSAPVGAAGRWIHVACVGDGASVVLYVDGIAQSSATAGSTPPQTDEIVAIGGNSPDGEPFVGALDDVRVFARARSADEVGAAAARP